MRRDYTQDTMMNLKRKVDEIEGEMAASLINPNTWQWEFPEVDFGECPYDIWQGQMRQQEDLQALPVAWNKELEQVHQVEEYHAARLMEIKELMDLYEQSVKKITEMFRVENICMNSMAYCVQLESCMKPYYEKRVERELLGGYLTNVQIENLRAMGYTDRSLLSLYAEFSETDRKFFAYLASGTQEDYQKAFMINPASLSPYMYVAMVDYARRLLTTHDGDCEQLEIFNNAMLASSSPLCMEDGTVTPYAERYIQYMCSYTDYILAEHMVVLESMEYGSEEYQKLYEVYFAEFSLLGLWATELAVVKGQVLEKVTSVLVQGGIQLNEMNYRADGTFSFKIGVLSEVNEGNAVIGGYTYLDEIPAETSLSIGYQNIHDAREELEGYWSEEISKHLFDIAWGVTCDTVPMLGTAAKYIDGVNKVQAMIEGYYAMCAKLEEIENEELARIFAIGGGCNIGGERMHCFYGLFDPEIYRRMREIERVGVSGLMGWDEMKSETGSGETILEEKKKNIDEDSEVIGQGIAQQCELQEALLCGGFSFEDFSYTNDNGDKVEVSAEEFIAAWDRIGAAECLRYGES